MDLDLGEVEEDFFPQQGLRLRSRTRHRSQRQTQPAVVELDTNERGAVEQDTHQRVFQTLTIPVMHEDAPFKALRLAERLRNHVQYVLERPAAARMLALVSRNRRRDLAQVQFALRRLGPGLHDLHFRLDLNSLPSRMAADQLDALYGVRTLVIVSSGRISSPGIARVAEALSAHTGGISLVLQRGEADDSGMIPELLLQVTKPFLASLLAIHLPVIRPEWHRRIARLLVRRCQRAVVVRVDAEFAAALRSVAGDTSCFSSVQGVCVNVDNYVEQLEVFELRGLGHIIDALPTRAPALRALRIETSHPCMDPRIRRVLGPQMAHLQNLHVLELSGICMVLRVTDRLARDVLPHLHSLYSLRLDPVAWNAAMLDRVLSAVCSPANFRCLVIEGEIVVPSATPTVIADTLGRQAARFPMLRRLVVPMSISEGVATVLIDSVYPHMRMLEQVQMQAWSCNLANRRATCLVNALARMRRLKRLSLPQYLSIDATRQLLARYAAGMAAHVLSSLDLAVSARSEVVDLLAALPALQSLCTLGIHVTAHGLIDRHLACQLVDVCQASHRMTDLHLLGDAVACAVPWPAHTLSSPLRVWSAAPCTFKQQYYNIELAPPELRPALPGDEWSWMQAPKIKRKLLRSVSLVELAATAVLRANIDRTQMDDPSVSWDVRPINLIRYIPPCSSCGCWRKPEVVSRCYCLVETDGPGAIIMDAALCYLCRMEVVHSYSSHTIYKNYDFGHVAGEQEGCIAADSDFNLDDYANPESPQYDRCFTPSTRSW